MANNTYKMEATSSLFSSVNTTTPVNIGTTIDIPACGPYIPVNVPLSGANLDSMGMELSGHPSLGDVSLPLTSNYKYSTTVATPNNGAAYSSNTFLNNGFVAVGALIGDTPKTIFVDTVTLPTSPATWAGAPTQGFFVPDLWSGIEIYWPIALGESLIYETYWNTWYVKRVCWPYGLTYVVQRQAYLPTACAF